MKPRVDHITVNFNLEELEFIIFQGKSCNNYFLKKHEFKLNLKPLFMIKMTQLNFFFGDKKSNWLYLFYYYFNVMKDTLVL